MSGKSGLSPLTCPLDRAVSNRCPVNQETTSPAITNPPSQASGLAIASFFCGLLSFVTAGLAGFVGVFLGHLSLSKIKKSAGTLHGRGFAIAGLVTGYLGIMIFLIVCGSVWCLLKTPTQMKPLQVTVDLREFTSALEMYRLNGGQYPTSEQGLHALVEKPTSSPEPKRWAKAMNQLHPDVWGNPYLYKFPGSKIPEKPEIISAGPDGIPGNTDDISSQELN